MKIGGYSGTAGDAITGSHSLNNTKFTTKDKDNDEIPSGNCATLRGGDGGWWYKFCMHSNLNGLNYNDGKRRSDGIYWYSSLKTVTMAIRPNNVENSK